MKVRLFVGHFGNARCDQFEIRDGRLHVGKRLSDELAAEKRRLLCNFKNAERRRDKIRQRVGAFECDGHRAKAPKLADMDIKYHRPPVELMKISILSYLAALEFLERRIFGVIQIDLR